MTTNAFDDGVRGSLAPAFAAWPPWARRFLGWPVRVVQARALLGQLGAMSERELADIGLSRADLRDATALPLGDDPSPFLGTRIAEGHEAASLERSVFRNAPGHRRLPIGLKGAGR